jgi:ABC-type Mn2+/Zn2+ transport system ATPase subunit
MRYKTFRIRNFKGIKDATVNLDSLTGASVFALVGLNESGKTTVLEAIHSFSPDENPVGLHEGRRQDRRKSIPQWVPRHQFASFSGDISVTAELSLDDNDIQEFIKEVLSIHQIKIKPSSSFSTMTLERIHRFKDGDYVGNFFNLKNYIEIKKKGERKWHPPTKEERTLIRDTLYSATPDICYFPTFVFNFPEKINLTNNKKGELNGFYRDVFQDVLDYDGQGHSIENDIKRRIRSPIFSVPWLNFLNIWGNDFETAKIQHVIDRAGATITNVVFGRWDRIFRESAKGKEVVISYEVSEGENIDENGHVVKTNEHDVSIKFVVKHGTRRFNVNDRSLGFRWFFAFMLFTQFRASRNHSRPLLFLFDEPASNLHAAAQQKLIECFPAIGKDGHAMIYTTHSHYMIEPRWLEQTFIVTNRADAPITSVVDGVSLDDESLDIQVTPYRAFVDKHPSQTSYFQPILDRLDVAPSRFDIQKSSIVLEGKSDYYIIRYAAQLNGYAEIPLERFPIILRHSQRRQSSLCTLRV